MNNKFITDEIIEKAFQYVNQKGFPYYKYSLEEKNKELNKLFKYDYSQIIKENVVKQTMHGLGLAWSYFPHAWEVKTRNMKTPFEIYENKDLLKKAIEKRLKRGGLEMLLPNGGMTDSQIRKAIRSYSGVQAVSNFRPSAAAGIYKKYANNGIVWDMSGGFGGRLLGAILSNNVKKYIATDPSTKTMIGLTQMADELNVNNIDIKLILSGSEKYTPTDNVDLCFTSPPYFNTEKYANESTQSFIAYDNQESWNENFLRKTIKNCYQCLKKDGFMLINIANVITHKTLEDVTVKIAGEEKFELIDILKMQLSSITKGGFKYEPIFVFKK